MKLSSFLTVKAVVSFIFAAVELLLPAALLSLSSVGGAATADTIYMTRTLGAAFVGVGLLCWFTRNAPRSDLRQGVLLALFCCDTLGFLVSLLAQLSGIVNTLHWAVVLIWLLFAAGLGYFRFLRPAE